MLSDIAEDAKIRSGISFTNRSAKNLLALETWLKMLRLMAIVMVMIMKQSKDHLFLRRQTYLQGILPLYALEKDKFLLIVLAIVKIISWRHYLNDYK